MRTDYSSRPLAIFQTISTFGQPKSILIGQISHIFLALIYAYRKVKHTNTFCVALLRALLVCCKLEPFYIKLKQIHFASAFIFTSEQHRHMYLLMESFQIEETFLDAQLDTVRYNSEGVEIKSIAVSVKVICVAQLNQWKSK